jgi:polyisoprenoid-binding protein YceI
MRRLLLLLLLLFGLSPLSAHADDLLAPYYIPPGQLSAMMQVMDMGYANDLVMFRTATGSFSYNDAGKTLSNLRLAIDTTSLISTSNESQRDLATFLGAAQFPEIRIAAPDSVTFADGKAQLKGTLTLHGVSKPVTIDATLNRSGKSPLGGGMWSSSGDAVGLSMRTSFKSADFGLGIDTATDSQPRFGETITLQLEMQAIKQ